MKGSYLWTLRKTTRLCGEQINEMVLGRTDSSVVIEQLSSGKGNHHWLYLVDNPDSSSYLILDLPARAEDLCTESYLGHTAIGSNIQRSGTDDDIAQQGTCSRCQADPSPMERTACKAETIGMMSKESPVPSTALCVIRDHGCNVGAW